MISQVLCSHHSWWELTTSQPCQLGLLLSTPVPIFHEFHGILLSMCRISTSIILMCVELWGPPVRTYLLAHSSSFLELYSFQPPQTLQVWIFIISNQGSSQISPACMAAQTNAQSKVGSGPHFLCFSSFRESVLYCVFSQIWKQFSVCGRASNVVLPSCFEWSILQKTTKVLSYILILDNITNVVCNHLYSFRFNHSIKADFYSTTLYFCKYTFQ